MQLMGGDVTAVSQEGQGARFTISWPVKCVALVLADTEPQHPIRSEVETYPSTRPMSVLLVEDHEINRKLAQIMLQRMGHAFVTANDGQQALDCLDKEPFDVVLLDVMMPVMDGITALKAWREREVARQLPRTTVLMVTAHAMTGDRERFIAAGADGYVSKPMSEAALRKEINRACLRNT
jgi:CheY-like chemotaxis protein